MLQSLHISDSGVTLSDRSTGRPEKTDIKLQTYNAHVLLHFGFASSCIFLLYCSLEQMLMKLDTYNIAPATQWLSVENLQS